MQAQSRTDQHKKNTQNFVSVKMSNFGHIIHFSCDSAHEKSPVSESKLLGVKLFPVADFNQHLETAGRLWKRGNKDSFCHVVSCTGSIVETQECDCLCTENRFSEKSSQLDTLLTNTYCFRFIHFRLNFHRKTQAVEIHQVFQLTVVYGFIC